MFPKYNFDDALTAIERLGRKKEVNHHMVRYRLDQLTKDDEKIMSDGDEAVDHNNDQLNEDVPMDEFEALIDEQIALTTVHSRTNASALDKSFDNMLSLSNSTQFNNNVSSSTHISQPSTSQQHFPSQHIQPSNTQHQQSLFSQPQSHEKNSQAASAISEEVRARIAENKKRALEKLELRKKEAEEREKLKAKESEPKNIISNILIDDDDDF